MRDGRRTDVGEEAVCYRFTASKQRSGLIALEIMSRKRVVDSQAVSNAWRRGAQDRAECESNRTMNSTPR